MRRSPNALCRLAGPLALLLAGALSSAHAGGIWLADGSFPANDIADSNFSSDGQFWQSPDVHATTAVTGNMTGLTLDFGSGPVTAPQFSFNPATGRLSFLNGSGVPTGSFVEPMHLSGGYNTDYANGFYTFGQLATQLLTATSFPTGPFDINTALNAYRFLWPQQCPTTAGVCSFSDLLGFEAVFIEIDPEDFELQFNYQNQFATLPANNTVTGLFQLGSNSATYTGPFVTTGPNYCFHDGSQVSCSAATVTVPEPETVPLLALGAFVVGAALRAGRRRRIAAA